MRKFQDRYGISVAVEDFNPRTFEVYRWKVINENVYPHQIEYFAYLKDANKRAKELVKQYEKKVR